MNRVENKRRRVVIDEIFEAGRKALAQAVEVGAHCLGGRNRIGAGRKIDADRDRRFAVKPRLDVLVFGAEFDPGDIFDPQQRAVGIGTQNDVAELLGCD
jgi:hypothetical protein